MKHIIVIVSIILFATLCILGTIFAPEPKFNKNIKDQANTLPEENEKTEETPYKQITIQEAIALMETESDYIILDVRTKKEYDELHIPHAINIPYEVIQSDEISELPNKDHIVDPEDEVP